MNKLSTAIAISYNGVQGPSFFVDALCKCFDCVSAVRGSLTGVPIRFAAWDQVNGNLVGSRCTVSAMPAALHAKWAFVIIRRIQRC